MNGQCVKCGEFDIDDLHECKIGSESSAVVRQRSVADYTAEELVVRAVRNARGREAGEVPRWVAVADTFALGSTYASQLCRIHGLDPGEKVNGPRCISCNP